MKREEAINTLRKFPIGLMDLESKEKQDITEAIDMALAALRGPTREQAEKAWRGEWERITDSYGKVEGFLCKCGTQTYSASNFCPRCGAPTTDEAVDIVMERLEKLYEDK